MTSTPHTCTQCLLHDQLEGVQINDKGICNHCADYKHFTPVGESHLIQILEKAKRKQKVYDALVPLSGGKDSTYVLYLARQRYQLNVLTYTFDNGFMSELAKSNIEKAVKKCGVDHIWVRHDPQMIHQMYRTTLLQSGEICGICGVGIERSMLKLSEAYQIPLILLGHSPTEANSFTSENIYDQARLKAILRTNKSINEGMVNRFLIYPNLNFISSYIYTLMGKFGKKINLLYYLPLPSDHEIGVLLKQEMDWSEPQDSQYTRHFDCHAEPLTNYVRQHRFGAARRLPQLSNMIRNKEISREEALKIYEQDQAFLQPKNFEKVLSELDLKIEDLEKITQIPQQVFSKEVSQTNRIFAIARRWVKK